MARSGVTVTRLEVSSVRADPRVDGGFIMCQASRLSADVR